MKVRTAPRGKALQIIKYFRHEMPNYNYLRAVFVHLRKELSVEVGSKAKKLPYVPTEEEIKRYYKSVWQPGGGKEIRWNGQNQSRHCYARGSPTRTPAERANIV